MKKVWFLWALIALLSLSSCESVFPDDNLDNYWRLRTIEYKSGYNFQGVACQKENVTDFMFGFARHLVEVDKVSSHFYKHGVTTVFGDSIRLDFSTYQTDVADSLKLCGVDSLVTVFRMDYPNKNRLELSNSKVVLSLEKW